LEEGGHEEEDDEWSAREHGVRIGFWGDDEEI
jgi:hypothetical protein